MYPPNNGLTRFVLDRTTRAIVVIQRCCKVITKHVTGTPILHVEASFISVERGLRRGILSWTSLKHYIHFSFILKLIIFIYKQLKRPVAFSVVHVTVQLHVLEFKVKFNKSASRKHSLGCTVTLQSQNTLAQQLMLVNNAQTLHNNSILAYESQWDLASSGPSGNPTYSTKKRRRNCVHPTF